MSDNTKASAPSGGAGEGGLMARHAATVWLGQMAVMGFGVVDTMASGHFDPSAQAALSVGAAMFVSVHLALMGVIQGLLPHWAQLHGAGDARALGASVRQSAWLAVGLTLLGVTVLLAPDALLAAAQVPDPLRPSVRSYLAIVAAALPLALGFRIYTTLHQAMGLPQLVTRLQWAGLALKVPLSLWWTFGGVGVPAMGLLGCAWATLAADAAMVLLAVMQLRRHPRYTPLDLWRWDWPDWAQLGFFLRLGGPAGAVMLVEVTSFTLMALLVARQGQLVAASHQIAANVAAIVYMLPLSLGIALAARIGWWRGQGDEARARQLARRGMAAALALGAVLALSLWLLGPLIPAVYSSDAAVIATAAALLPWVAAFQLADCVQTVALFALRCWGVTVTPLVIYTLVLWGLGLGGGWALAYGPAAAWAHTVGLHGAAPMWASAFVALTLVAGSLALLLRHTLGRSH